MAEKSKKQKAASASACGKDDDDGPEFIMDDEKIRTASHKKEEQEHSSKKGSSSKRKGKTANVELALSVVEPPWSSETATTTTRPGAVAVAGRVARQEADPPQQMTRRPASQGTTKRQDRIELATGHGEVTRLSIADDNDDQEIAASHKRMEQEHQHQVVEDLVGASLVTASNVIPESMVHQITERLRAQLEEEYERQQQGDQQGRRQQVGATVTAVKVVERSDSNDDSSSNNKQDDNNNICGLSKKCKVLILIGALAVVVVGAIVAVVLVLGGEEPTTPTSVPPILAPTDGPTSTNKRNCPPFVNVKTQTITLVEQQGAIFETSILGTNVDASMDALLSTPSCGAFTGPAVLYRLDVPVIVEESTTYLIHTCSAITSFDTVLSVYIIDAFDQECNTIGCIGFNDNVNLQLQQSYLCRHSNFHSAIEITMSSSHSSNPVYYIAVSGRIKSETGSFELSILKMTNDFDPGTLEPTMTGTREPTLPAMILLRDGGPCPQSGVLPLLTGSTTTTSGSTDGLPLMDIYCLDSSVTTSAVWYEFQPNQAGTFLLDTCSPRTNFDTVLVVYAQVLVVDGECLMQCVGFNDDHVGVCPGSLLNSAMEIVSTSPDDVFYIALVGSNHLESGSFDLHVTELSD